MSDEKLTTVQQLLNDGWEIAGSIGVDAGCVMVGDPCYGSSKNHPASGWSEFCDRLVSPESSYEDDGFTSIPYDLGHEGLGVVVNSGYGDGQYPVMVRRGPEDRIAELRVLFIEAEEDVA